jgi:IclR family KDG regulon transcriptional repressor
MQHNVPMKPSTERTIQSVERFISILFAFSEVHPRWRLFELSRFLDLHPSTVSHLLTTAKKAGVIEHNTNTGEYELGLRILALSEVITANLDLLRVASGHLSSLAHKSKEDAFLAVLDGDQAVTLAYVASPRILSSRQRVGVRLEPSCTSGGKLLLAYGQAREVTTLLRKGLKRSTTKSITDPEEFCAELRRIRRRGFAISDEELEEGLIAVAAPVSDRKGNVVAAVSASGPKPRIGGDRLQALIVLVVEAGREISRALGAKSPEGHAGLPSTRLLAAGDTHQTLRASGKKNQAAP